MKTTEEWETKIDAKLDKVYTKLDKLGEAVIVLVRVEERQVADRSLLVDLTSSFNKHVDDDAKNFADLNKKVTENTLVKNALTHFVWIVVAGVVGVLVKVFSG